MRIPFFRRGAAPLVSCVYHTIRARGLQTREALEKKGAAHSGGPFLSQL